MSTSERFAGLRRTLGTVAGAGVQGAMRRRAAHGAVVLGYHDVCIDADESDADPWTVSVSRLAEQLRLVRSLGLRFVPVAELADRIDAGDDVDGLCVVTFDDALDGLHRHGLDVLAELDVPAVVYVVSESLGTQPDWWANVSPVMTDAQLGDLVAAGHELGSHTRTHRSLVEVDDLVTELAGSRHALVARTGQPVDTIAYPSGHHDARVRAAARGAGYRLGFTFLNGRIVGGEDPFRLPRLTMGSHLDRPRLAYHLLRSAESWPDHQLERVAALSR